MHIHIYKKLGGISTMKKYLMKYKVNMLLVVIVSLLAGMAGSYFFDNRWLGMFIVVPMCALYI